MIINANDIKNIERIERLKLINSICGVRGVHLIASKSKKKISNLAIFSSITHLGSNPALLSFISRPSGEFQRDTINNIKETKFFTINSVEENFISNAHQTSGKYYSHISEFKTCGFSEEYINNFTIPFVKKSQVKIGMKLIDIIQIKHNKTEMVIGEIILIKTKYDNLEENFQNTTSIIGLNSYYSTKKITELPYVRIEDKH